MFGIEIVKGMDWPRYSEKGKTVSLLLRLCKSLFATGKVDAHNRWRHDGGANQGLSIEETWDTKRWENRVLAFIIAITEVNAYLAMA